MIASCLSPSPFRTGYNRLNYFRRKLTIEKLGEPILARITITEELYKKIEEKAQEEGLSTSKLAEKLLTDVTTPKTMSCPRCAFRF